MIARKYRNFCLRDTAICFSFSATLLMAPMAVAQPHGTQSGSPLAGQWHCTSTAMRLPASKAIPAGSMVQSTSYKADSQGRWVSNSILQYQADKGGGRLQIHTVASGIHSVTGQIVTEHIQRFQITKPNEPDDAFARSARPIFNLMLNQTLQRNPRQRYQLLQSAPHRYVMQPIHSSGQKTTQRISCQKVGTP